MQLEHPSLTMGLPLEDLNVTPEERAENITAQLKESSDSKRALIIKVSHIGGHKYAGNCIVSLSPFSPSTWDFIWISFDYFCSPIFGSFRFCRNADLYARRFRNLVRSGDPARRRLDSRQHHHRRPGPPALATRRRQPFTTKLQDPQRLVTQSPSLCRAASCPTLRNAGIDLGLALRHRPHRCFKNIHRTVCIGFVCHLFFFSLEQSVLVSYHLPSHHFFFHSHTPRPAFTSIHICCHYRTHTIFPIGCSLCFVSLAVAYCLRFSNIVMVISLISYLNLYPTTSSPCLILFLWRYLICLLAFLRGPGVPVLFQWTTPRICTSSTLITTIVCIYIHTIRYVRRIGYQ